AVNGLYHQVMSATPTTSSTGLTSWLNQGSATVTDSAVGIDITAPSSGGAANITGRFLAAPAAPYTFTALVAATRNSNNFNGVGIGWYDGTGKLQTINYVLSGGGTPFFQIVSWASVTVAGSIDV